MEFEVDYDLEVLKNILDEAPVENEYIEYKGKKYIKEEYCIPKSKIKEKLEELEHEKFKRTQLGVFLLKNYENQKLLAKIQVLEELLGDKNV